ncbi:MAG: hypothetical protein ACM3ZQ_06800 [Bacillota bacterium]
MNYWLRLVIQVGGGLATYTVVSRFIRPVKNWLMWMLWVFALNGGVVLLAEQVIKSTGWSNLYTRLIMETIGIGVVLALMPRHLLKKNQPKAETPVAAEKDQKPQLKKRKKPKI